MHRIILFLLAFRVIHCEEYVRKPFYKYRYETEDVMKTSASNVPIHGYHVVEGGYYPTEVEHGGVATPGLEEKIANIGEYIEPEYGASEIGGLGFGGAYVRPEFGYYRPIGPVGLGGFGFGGPHHGYGGGAINTGEFNKGNKKFADEQYQKEHSEKGEEKKHGESGFHKDAVAVKNVKGDSGYFKDVDGAKHAYEDGREYNGGQHFNNQGQSEKERTAKQGHKKGHKIKSFKNSHHKDETGKEEEFYDEAHDEGGNYAFKGEQGGYGEKAESSFKGGNKEEKYKAGEAKKEGHFSNEEALEKENSNEGKFGGNKYADNQVLYGLNKGTDEQSLLGHQESSKYYKAHPFIVPFHYRK